MLPSSETSTFATLYGTMLLLQDHLEVKLDYLGLY